MNIYRTELKSHWKSLIFWSLGIFGFMLAAMSKYQGYSRSGQSINELLDSLPGGVSSLLGANILDLQSAGGFFAMCALYLAIMLGVHAVLLGSGIIAKEETDKTIEFLVTKPVTRNRIFLAKVLAAATAVVFLNIVALIASIVTVNMFNEGPPINSDIIFLMPAVLFIQLIFLAVGVSFAAIMRRPKRAGIFSAAVLLATFILSSFVDITDRYDFLRYLTPFQYFDPKTIFAENAYKPAYILIATVAFIIMLAVSRFAYKSRDFII
jgi:ABC-2 type transport system permease protein